MIEFRKSPQDEIESREYANALYIDGGYPAGVSECFTVGISGGCALDCFVLLKGECKCIEEVLEWHEGTEEEKYEIEKIYNNIEK